MNAIEEHPLPQMLELWQATLGWQPNAEQQQQFEQLYRLILESNRQFNLTRITAPEDFWEKHLWDSLRGIWSNYSAVEENQDPLRAIDIGTGAGFPGLPVAIVHPHWQLTLLDSTRKKVTFLEQVVTALGVSHCTPLCDRAEALTRIGQHRAKYDLALVRAVAAAPLCAKYALPLLKPGGRAILYRGQWTEAEAIELQESVTKLGSTIDATIEATDAFTTPISGSVRHCISLLRLR